MVRWAKGIGVALALSGCGALAETTVRSPSEPAVAAPTEVVGEPAEVAVQVPVPTVPSVDADDEQDAEDEAFDGVDAPTPQRWTAPPPRPKDPYLALRYDIEQERRELAHRRRAGEPVLDVALATLTARLPQLIEAWKGTRWSYSGTSQTPKKGKIACGYFISTVLVHAGFAVDRVDLARQPSEQILRTLIREDEIRKYSYASEKVIAKHMEDHGAGIYLIGLDTHIGFGIKMAGRPARFCHSTNRHRKIGVICEDARTSPTLDSRYTVIGKLDDPTMLEAWLGGAPLPAARKGKPQPPALLAANDWVYGPTL